MAREALLVDLDGTVWDVRPFYRAAILARAGRFATRHLADLDNGRSVARILRDLGVTERSFPGLLRQYAHGIDLYEGVWEALHELDGTGVPLGVVTNLPSWIALPLLDVTGIRPRFSSIVHYGRTSAHKPSPQPILAGLAELGLAPTPDIWYVGDSPSDCTAALSAGISFAWASYGYFEDCPGRAEHVLDCFPDVLAL